MQGCDPSVDSAAGMAGAAPAAPYETAILAQLR